jgi:hypothetical protein
MWWEYGTGIASEMVIREEVRSIGDETVRNIFSSILILSALREVAVET